jgi:hypothetical protein
MEVLSHQMLTSPWKLVKKGKVCDTALLSYNIVCTLNSSYLLLTSFFVAWPKSEQQDNCYHVCD